MGNTRCIPEAPQAYINKNICHSNYYIQNSKATNTEMNYNNTTKALQSVNDVSTLLICFEKIHKKLTVLIPGEWASRGTKRNFSILL